MHIVGEANVETVHHSKKFVETVVVEANGSALFGRNWLKKIQLDWKKICALRSSADIVAEFPSVFEDGLGTIKDCTASIHLQGDPAPKCTAARPAR